MQGRKWQVAEYGGTDKLQLASFDVPQPERGHVRLRVLATTATYTDLLIIHGQYRPNLPLPATPGYDCIGEVEAVGDGVTGLVVGDRVAAMPQGTCMTTHLILPEGACVKVRPDVEPEHAVAVVLTGVTAYQMLHRATGGRLARGAPDSHSILVHGAAGGTGAMLVELAKLAGIPPKNIYGTCSARHLHTVRDMGVNAIDYGAADWAAEVLRGTGGAGVDAVFDHVVARGYLQRGLSCVRRGGKYIAYGVTNSAAPGTFSMSAMAGVFARLWLQQSFNSWVSGTEAEFYNVAGRRSKRPDEFAADLRTLMDMVADGRLKPLVGRVWDFDHAKEALASIEAGAHTGKQIIRVGGEGAGAGAAAASSGGAVAAAPAVHPLPAPAASTEQPPAASASQPPAASADQPPAATGPTVDAAAAETRPAAET